MRLISEKYRETQAQLHRDPTYGNASVTYAPIVAGAANVFKPARLLDYGAGKQRLKKALEPRMAAFEYIPYEPSDPSCCEPPAPCEFVACVDVMEHIEPDLLDNVLDDLKRVIEKAGVITVSTVPAKRLLPDGRNAHLIVQPMEWWLPHFMARWNLYAFQRLPFGFFVVVEKRHEH